MGQEAFDEFYLREYPKVVGLLQGLLRSRLVAEELAQETFLVAYRDWARVGSLDNPPTTTPRSGRPSGPCPPARPR